MLFTKEELQEVKGVGPKTAENIVNFIQEKKVKNIYRLKEVEKVGKVTLNNIIDRFSIIEIEFDLSDLETGDSSELIEEVHLVGDMNDWQTANKDYSLFKTKNNNWQGAFRLEEGTEYKALYNSERWDKNCLSDNFGENFVV